MTIKVVPLGAGQDVGRSCVLVSVGGKNIMFDCGMHMGYNDERRFPDFSYISKSKQFNQAIDCVIITHFHLDHCGALPYFTEMCGFDGPVYMTHPTKAICPILLEDYRKITVEKKGETNFFTSQMIKGCMRKVRVVNLHQTILVDEELEIRAYYAGHVLGAAMFLVRSRGESVVYTGDYNMTPDRHLGAAWIERIRPDLLITETTYATTIRDSKRAREHTFLKRVHECVDHGGKVLIPVFALGRAQELCILIDAYWEQMNHLKKVPIYFAAGMVEKANLYYKLFINWTNQKIKKTFVQRNLFDFRNIKPFERHQIDAPGPMVLFATPGMLHSGLSLDVFKKWAGNELNLVVIPGYCVVGTVGNKLLTGRTQTVEIDKKTTLDVKCKIANLSFSAHADAKGIMQLLRMAEPRAALLVHGEKNKMAFLRNRVMEELNIPCFDPPNGATVTINTSSNIPVDMSRSLIKRALAPSLNPMIPAPFPPHPRSNLNTQGLVLMRGTKVRVVDVTEAGQQLGLAPHTLLLSTSIPILTQNSPVSTLVFRNALSQLLPHHSLVLDKEVIVLRSIQMVIHPTSPSPIPPSQSCTSHVLSIEWNWTDEALASHVISIARQVVHDFVKNECI